MSNTTRKTFKAAAALFCSASAVTTYAQDSVGLEEIIVTARKVEENLQETPIAITAFSGDALVERQIHNTNVLDQVVPNLQFADNAPLAGNNSSTLNVIPKVNEKLIKTPAVTRTLCRCQVF